MGVYWLLAGKTKWKSWVYNRSRIICKELCSVRQIRKGGYDTDDTLALLKQEISQTTKDEHDLAKWKLGVTAALGAAAFGLVKDGSPTYWLLLFVPFVCAYVDLYAYQYEIRIRVISQFLAAHSHGDVLGTYEQECRRWRDKGVFSLGNWAGIGCSLGACLFGPAFYLLQSGHDKGPGSLLVPPVAAFLIWLVGVVLIVFLWVFFKYQARRIEGEGV